MGIYLHYGPDVQLYYFSYSRFQKLLVHIVYFIVKSSPYVSSITILITVSARTARTLAETVMAQGCPPHFHPLIQRRRGLRK